MKQVSPRTLPPASLVPEPEPGRSRKQVLVVGGCILVFLLWATYTRGLLMAADQRLASIAVLLVGAAVAWRFGLPIFWNRPAVLALLAYLIGHTLSLPFMVTPIEAVPGFIYYALVLGSCFALGAWAGRFREAISLAAGIITIVAGAASWFGFLAMTNVVFSRDAFTGRLASTLQYPNAYAALALLGILAAVGVASGRRFMAWRHPLLFACFLGLLLSGSRGGILVGALALAGYAVATFWTLPQFTMILGIHGAAAAVAYSSIVPLLGQQGVPARTTLTVIILAAGAATGLAWGVEAVVRALRPTRRILQALGVVFALAGMLAVALYGGPLVDRAMTLLDYGNMTTLNVSDLSRAQHLRDAWNIAVDRPLGSGVRGWWVLYPQYQPFRYVINIAHSFLAETAVAAGFLGAVGLLAIWLTLAHNYLRRVGSPSASPAWHGLFWGLAALGLHSTIVDADMNFMVLSLVAFTGIGMMEGATAGVPSGARTEAKVRLAVVVSALAGVAVLTSFLIGDLFSNRGMDLAIRGDLVEAKRALQTATTLNPIQPVMHVNASYLARQMAVGSVEDNYLEEARRHMERAVAVDPGRPDYRVDHAAILAELGEVGAARRELDRAVRLAPWQVRYWEKLLEFEIESARAFREAGRESQFQEHRAAAQNVLNMMHLQEAKVPKLAGALGLELASPRLTELRSELEKLP